jgi:DsbC/DsbD-like thiol-disulfide interchange protein
LAAKLRPHYTTVMNVPILRRVLLLCPLAASLALTNVGSPAIAADASPWAEDVHSAVRLIAGAPSRTGEVLHAGVEVKLAPGWKTYWRYPGDSGVPPRFDFSQSKNVKSVTVSWPAPQRLSDASGTSIGYKGGVTWPLRIEAEQPGKAVKLALKLDYAICEKLCIPAEATADLTLNNDPSTHEAVLAAAEQRVPKPAALGEGLPTITAVHRDGTARPPRVTVDVAGADGKPLDLFVEGPSPDWALPLPVEAPAPDGRRRFTFELDGLPGGAEAKGAQLRFTLVAPSRAVEVTTHLD